MTITIGRRIGAAGSLPFFVAVFNEMYQRYKVYDCPAFPDASRGYIFRESADIRGNLIRYVTAELHHLITISTYATEAAVVVAIIAIFLGNKIDKNSNRNVTDS